MISHVYLAIGTSDGTPLMKVGKANNVKNRQKGLTVRIEYASPCDTEQEAFMLENSVRNYARRIGARRYQNRNDWFVFDSEHYKAIKAFFFNEVSEETLIKYPHNIDEDELDIESLRQRYKELLFSERVKAVSVEKAKLVARQRDQRELELEAKIREAQAALDKLKLELRKLKETNRLNNSVDITKSA